LPKSLHTHTPASPLTDFRSALTHLLRWIPIAALIGILAGSASALLLASLDFATSFRDSHTWIIWLLAPAGGLVGLLYKHLGGSVEPGNNLILDEIHDPRQTIPLRMTPLILLGTFLTHLFGGSAGREGTAIQTGASLADQLSRPFRLDKPARRIVLMAGISAGFGSVFGTPLAGAIFGIEVLAVGRLSYEAIAPCIMAAFIADLVTRACHIHHTVYRITAIPSMSFPGILWSILAGIAFGLVAQLFARLTHAVTALAKRFIASAPLRPVVGGLIVSVAVFAIGTTRYIGLGIPTILDSFARQLPFYDFAAKILFTAVTLGTGFKGGEVTPLFFIGSTFGNALSHILPLPPSLLAGMGFVAVFAGAANTPIASTLMAVELFGGEAGAYAGIACVLSYLFSGNTGIYHSQRIALDKHHTPSSDPDESIALTAKEYESHHPDQLT
jgi:H+/Cl- antiporter ClcA